MKIFLLGERHEAISLYDGSEYIQIEPETEGVLYVAGRSIPVMGDKVKMPLIQREGTVQATFVTKQGIEYSLINPKITNGMPISRYDQMELMLRLWVRMDKLEASFADTNQNLKKIQGIYDKDALWFMKEEKV